MGRMISKNSINPKMIITFLSVRKYINKILS